MKLSAKVNARGLTSFTFSAVLALGAASALAQAPATPAPTPPPVAAPAAAPQGSSTLSIKVKGIRNTKGKIGVVLYGKEDGFPMDPTSAVARKLVDIDPSTMTATAVFENLPAGNYAATVLHDENGVGKMEFDSQGIPIEGYGISNNPDSSSGPPSFDAAKFAVSGPAAATEISMVYWQ